MQEKVKNEKVSVWKALCFSNFLMGKDVAHKIAYIAVMTALAVIVNTLEIKLTVAQFSFTIFFTALAGVFLGGVVGFCVGFLGDMIGFFLHPMGEYSPWIGISTGLMAFLVAICVLLFKGETMKQKYAKLAVGSLLIFVCCTCGITALYLNLVWYKSMTYFEYIIERLFVEGQILNSLVNSAMIIFLLPRLEKIKILGIKL